MEEISRFANLPVYTKEGTFVGNVKNLLLDLTEQRVDSLIIGRTNTVVVPDGRDVAVPYRWVASFNDILILRYLPDLSSLAPTEEEESSDEAFDEVKVEESEETPAPGAKPASASAPRREIPARR